MNPTIALEHAILYAHNQSRKLDTSTGAIVIQTFIHGVRSVVNGITGSENIGRLEKVPMYSSKTLLELGWKEMSGNHGFLSTETGLPIEMVCLQLADLTRASFYAYYTLAQKDGVLAIQKTYPQSGGTRGMASHSDAILINDADIPHGGDLTSVLKTFPDEVEEIGRRSSGLKQESREGINLQIKNLNEVLHGVFHIMEGKTVHFPGIEMTNIEVIEFLLDLYSLLPKDFRKNFHPIQITNDGTINYPLSRPAGW